MGSDGNRQHGTSYWDQQAEDLETAYQAQRDQNDRALAAAQQRAREAEAAQQEALSREYQGTNRQLYRDYMQQQRTLPQQMAAQGYTGGLTESSRLRLGNAYGEALNNNEQARIGQSASYAQTLAQQLYEAQATRDAANNEAMQNYYSQRSQLAAQRQSALEQRAATLAAQGDFSLYRELGYTDKEIKYLERMFRKQHPELYKTKSSKSSGGKGRGSYAGAGAGAGAGTETGAGTEAGVTAPRENGNYQRWLQYQQQRQPGNGNYQRWLQYQLGRG